VLLMADGLTVNVTGVAQTLPASTAKATIQTADFFELVFIASPFDFYIFESPNPHCHKRVVSHTLRLSQVFSLTPFPHLINSASLCWVLK